MTAFVAIGNSDDKLTQQQWARFCYDAETLIHAHAKEIHGAWTSATRDPWQNACWCFVPWPHLQLELKEKMARLARRYGQESIAWTDGETELLEADAGGVA